MNFQELIKKLVKSDIRKNLYVKKSDIDNLRLFESERLSLELFLKSKNIKIVSDEEIFFNEYNEFINSSYYKNLELPRILSKEEVYEKFLLYKKNKDLTTRKELVIYNMSLVVFISYKYSKLYNIDIEQLKSYGYEGLLLAIEEFNVASGDNFLNFAINYIKKYVLIGSQEILTNSKSKFSFVYINAKKIIESRYETTLKDSPELIEKLIELLTVTKAVKDGVVTKKIVNFLNPVSLDVVDDYMSLSDEFVLETDYVKLKEEIDIALESLTIKQEEVLRFRYGFYGKCYSVGEVAKKLGYSHKIIKNIEQQAFDMLRHPLRLKKLSRFLEDETLVFNR